ncbi:hypothetical protein BDZ45DRAFT_740936 [Acephala macrosclerotiorum]|nr:hypothetical protein BDZ45DRAFT_740936 [Acephala macrosclerotiorum]
MPTLNNAGPGEVVQFLTSNLFTLVPSGSDTELKIHQALLKSLSPAFKSTSEGGWAETELGIHKFLGNTGGEDAVVTEEVLLCFITWAYLGDYNTETVDVASQVTGNNAIDNFGGVKSKSVKMQGKAFPVNIYYDDAGYPYEGYGNQAVASATAVTKSNTSSQLGTSGTTTPRPHYLLLNIQIYVFANIYLIQPLKALAQEKTIAYLESKQNNRKTEIDVVVDALDYALTHLPDADELLDWLAKYSIWNIEALRSDFGRFDTLMRKADARFAGLLMKHVVPSHISPFQRQKNQNRYY